ncbi:hypothetical protein [Georgenia sp. AZ-5]|uniref:hypothetical protein n=1 Tax=Georgenia sp. AZ-5 TaxID=3367526 RepID=UPI0037540963
MSRTQPPGSTPLLLASGFLGLVVAVCGTLVHRWEGYDLPAGLLLALVAVAVGAVAARATGDAPGAVAYGLAGLLASQAMTYLGPGGDVLVTDEPISFGWLIGLPLVTALVALTPPSWYADRPAGAARRHGRAGAVGDE